MRLKEITFLLENCEVITFNGKHIGDFFVGSNTTEFCRIACNSIDQINITNDFAIEIHKDANVEKHGFEDDKIFDRLCRDDITCIEFTLYDEKGYGNTYLRYVKWGNGNYQNELQTHYISDLGHLYITIGNCKFGDHFDIEKINDKDYINYKFGAYEVGNK